MLMSLFRLDFHSNLQVTRLHVPFRVLLASLPLNVCIPSLAQLETRAAYIANEGRACKSHAKYTSV